MMEEMSVSGAAGPGGPTSGFGGSPAAFGNTQGSTSSAGALSPPLSPMYSSPKGVSPRTNILPSFAWGKTMLKHLKRRPPAGSAALRAHETAAMRASGELGGRGGGGVEGIVGSGGWAGGLEGAGGGVEGEGGFVYPAGMVQGPMHFEAFTFVLTAGCWPLQSVSSSFKPPAPIEDYVVSFLDFYGEVIYVCAYVVCVHTLALIGNGSCQGFDVLNSRIESAHTGFLEHESENIAEDC